MKTVFIFISFILFCCSCEAQTTSDRVNPDAEYKKIDKELNTVYQTILFQYQNDTTFLKNLKKSQRIWIQFRDAELAMKYPKGEKNQHKNLSPFCRALYLTDLTNERISTLRLWLQGVKDTNECTGSIQKLNDSSMNLPHIIYVFEQTNVDTIEIPKGLEFNSENVSADDFVEDGNIAVVQYDLNGDGSPEYFVKSTQTLCGNGGCSYLIYNGKTLRLLGQIFGEPIYISEGKHYGFFSIMSYSHQSAGSGNWTVYEYNGREYKVTESKYLEGDDVESLFEIINRNSKTQ
jgi:uncharacterized protein YecT (DUF1311 family)